MKIIFSERNEKSSKIYKCEQKKMLRTEKDVTHVSSIKRTEFLPGTFVLFDNEELILSAVNE